MSIKKYNDVKKLEVVDNSNGGPQIIMFDLLKVGIEFSEDGSLLRVTVVTNENDDSLDRRDS
jgi:hypothetical protein